MSSLYWRRLTFGFGGLCVAVSLAWLVALGWNPSLGILRERARYGVVGPVLAALSWFAGERYRAARRREFPHAYDCRCAACDMRPWKERDGKGR